jgi:hypothetical protein
MITITKKTSSQTNAAHTIYTVECKTTSEHLLPQLMELQDILYRHLPESEGSISVYLDCLPGFENVLGFNTAFLDPDAETVFALAMWESKYNAAEWSLETVYNLTFKDLDAYVQDLLEFQDNTTLPASVLISNSTEVTKRLLSGKLNHTVSSH